MIYTFCDDNRHIFINVMFKKYRQYGIKYDKLHKLCKKKKAEKSEMFIQQLTLSIFISNKIGRLLLTPIFIVT